MADISATRQAIKTVSTNRPLHCPKCGSEQVEIRLFSEKSKQGRYGRQIHNGWTGYCNHCQSRLTEIVSDPRDAAQQLVDGCKVDG